MRRRSTTTALQKLGTMRCHADVVNYGSLPYTDFRRTKEQICGDGALSATDKRNPLNKC